MLDSLNHLVMFFLFVWIIEINVSDSGNFDERASPTLVTKVMLEVFGNVPALDGNFCKGFGFSKYFSKSLLRRISDYHQANKEEFDRHRIKIINFSTEMETDRYYTNAKLIDMVGFI